LNLRVTLSAAFLAMGLAACHSSSAPPAAGPTAPSTPNSTTDSDMPSTGAASMACGDKTSANPAVAQKVPPGFPTVAGWVGTDALTQGRTVVLRGAVKGDPDEIVQARDAAVGKLTAAGYARTGGDEEPGFEADADFTGPHSGNINVRALCRDYLVVTYTLAE
jgi:hypothetical protein